MDPTIYILTGFTAVGKTELSLKWAERNQAEIVNCDSLLFYKYMDIGTAKPTFRERARVPHHMIDIAEPSDQYSIHEYVKAVRETVSEIHSRGKRVLVVGGSGFYLNGFLVPVVDEVEMEPSERERIETLFQNQPLSESVQVLRALNPQGLGWLDEANPRRVLKAWLRCHATGKTLAQLHEQFSAQSGVFDSFGKELLVLSRPRKVLEKRVRLRVEAMLSEGLIEEVRRLLDLGIEQNSSASRAIGYRETIQFLRGELAEDELAGLIAQNTRRLLKKQRTWFKKFLPHESVFDVSTCLELPDCWCHIPAMQSS